MYYVLLLIVPYYGKRLVGLADRGSECFANNELNCTAQQMEVLK